MGNTHTVSANTWTRITCGAFSFAGTPVQTQLKAHTRHAWAHAGVSRRAVLSVLDRAHGGDGLTSHISSVPHRQTRQSESRAGGVLAKSISGSALHMLGLACRCKQLSRTGWITTWWLGVKYSNNVHRYWMGHLTLLSGFVCVFQALNASILKPFSAEEHLGGTNSGRYSTESLPAFESHQKTWKTRTFKSEGTMAGRTRIRRMFSSNREKTKS